MNGRGSVRPVMAGRRLGFSLAGLALAVAGMAVTLAPTVKAAATCATPTSGGDWPMYGHDHANTREQDQETTLGPEQVRTLAPAWTFTPASAGGSGDFPGTPVEADGCVVAGSSAADVFSLNADTGQAVWVAHLDPSGGSAIDSSAAVADGRVFVSVSHVGAPFVAALDEATGTVLWRTQLDSQPGADAFGSPTVFDGLVIQGVSGGSAELAPTSERNPFEGSFVILDESTGTMLRKTWTIHPPSPDPSHPVDLYAGATVWSTAAVDPTTKVAFLGTGNPYRPEAQASHADAILKVDVDESSPTFGSVLGYYQGLPDNYLAAAKRLPCVDIPGNPPPYYPQGLGRCMQEDLDFGASPNLFSDHGRLLVGEGQKSGVYHAVDASTMRRVWTAIVGPPGSVGGVVGSTAYDGREVVGPITEGGYLWAVRSDSYRASAHPGRGVVRWAEPVGDAVHWGNPASVADGVAYTVDLKGFLDAYDAATGVPLLQRPLAVGGHTGTTPVVSWGGVSIARHTVYAAVGTTALGSGFIIALRPAPLPARAGA